MLWNIVGPDVREALIFIGIALPIYLIVKAVTKKVTIEDNAIVLKTVVREDDPQSLKRALREMHGGWDTDNSRGSVLCTCVGCGKQLELPISPIRDEHDTTFTCRKCKETYFPWV